MFVTLLFSICFLRHLCYTFIIIQLRQTQGVQNEDFYCHQTSFIISKEDQF